MVVLTVLVVVGLLATGFESWAVRRHLGRRTVPGGGDLPPVSILKPLCGLDSELAANLESFYRLDYPRYELLFGVASADDPALPVAMAVAAAHPEVPSRVIVDGRTVGLNPKVNNLANLERHAAYDLLLISDSNVRVPTGYLTELVALLHQPGVGLVSSPVVAEGGATLGARLEGLQLNTFVLGGVTAMHRLGGVCVMGKSMLLRRATLAELGGFRFLGRFLAEDQVCGQEVARRGHAIALASLPVRNVMGPLSVRQFLARHLRWARIRRHVAPLGFLGEALLTPVVLAALGLVLEPSATTAALLGTAVLAKATFELLSERAAGVHRSPLAYLFLSVVKEMLVGLAWFVPWGSSHVRWRGNSLRIGRRTELRPVVAAPRLGEGTVGVAEADLEPARG